MKILQTHMRSTNWRTPKTNRSIQKETTMNKQITDDIAETAAAAVRVIYAAVNCAAVFSEVDQETMAVAAEAASSAYTAAYAFATADDEAIYQAAVAAACDAAADVCGVPCDDDVSPDDYIAAYTAAYESDAADEIYENAFTKYSDEVYENK